MRIAELMSTTLVTASPSTPVVEARALMTEKRIRHLLVVNDSRLVGIVTDRDIRLNLPSPATSLSVWELNYLLAQLTVDKVMTRTVRTIAPDRDVREAARVMAEQKVGALPVVKDGRPVGIVTETDMLHAFVKLVDQDGPRG